MTLTPLIGALPIYREYIQNAADSIDKAIEEGLYRTRKKPLIKIKIARRSRNIIIRDNGAGVPNSKFKSVLTALGASQKRGTKQRGFRGVGRLSGLTYAKHVIFRSKSEKDQYVYELLLDGLKLRSILAQPHWDGTLEDAVKEIALMRTLDKSGYPEHFFEVELDGVANVQNDILLNVSEVKNYLSQVAPVSYDPEFSFSSEIANYLERYGINKTYSISFNDDDVPLYRPYTNKFSITDELDDEFRDNGLELFELPGRHGKPSAIGWFIHHSYYGAIPKSQNIHGLRMRIGNIQVGGPALVADLFPQPRFNSWTVGELHVLDPEVLPNDGRDDFETSPQYQRVQDHLSNKLKVIGNECQKQSMTRNKIKEIKSKINDIDYYAEVLESALVPDDVRDAKKEEFLNDVNKFKQLPIVNDDLSNDISELFKQIDLSVNKINGVKRKGRNPLNFIRNTRERDIYSNVIASLFRVKGDIKEAYSIAMRIVADLKE